MERLDALKKFLEQNQLSDADFTWLPSDASFRKYARINKKGKSYILMDAPPPEIPGQFAIVDHILRENGLSAPKIYGQDLQNGYLLLEDFGDDTYTRLLNKGENEETLYKLAIDSLFEIQKITHYDKVPLYDESWLKYGLDAFLDWFIPAALGQPLALTERQKFIQIWQDLFKQALQTPKGLILIDYHVDNLIRLKDRTGSKACGLLDFQDARIGPFTYDLASLLEDARRDVPAKLKQQMWEYYMAHVQPTDLNAFIQSYHILAVKRHIRVIGVFTRLKARDGKDRYLPHIPRVWRLLESHFNEPYLFELKKWFDQNIPPELRKVPTCLLAQK